MESSNLIFGLRSEWAILLAIFILTSVQLIKTILEGTRTKKEKIERNRRMETLGKIEIYLKILSDKYTEEVTERQLPILIKEFMLHCKESITVSAYSCITRNDVINQEKDIRIKLSRFIQNHFQSSTVNLGLFKWKGEPISNFIDPNWCSEITKGVLEIVIKVTRIDKPRSYRQLGSFMGQKFENYITEILSKAYDL